MNLSILTDREVMVIKDNLLSSLESSYEGIVPSDLEILVDSPSAMFSIDRLDAEATQSVLKKIKCNR